MSAQEPTSPKAAEDEVGRLKDELAEVRRRKSGMVRGQGNWDEVKRQEKELQSQLDDATSQLQRFQRSAQLTPSEPEAPTVTLADQSLLAAQQEVETLSAHELRAHQQADDLRRTLSIASFTFGVIALLITFSTNGLGSLAKHVAELKDAGNLAWWLGAKALSTVAGLTTGILLIEAARRLARPSYLGEGPSSKEPDTKGLIDATVDLFKAITAKLKKK